MENKQMESPPPNPIGACRDGYTANFLYIHKFTCFASGSMYNPNSIALYVYIYIRASKLQRTNPYDLLFPRLKLNYY